MSTGYEHPELTQNLSFEAIDRKVKKFNLAAVVVQGAVKEPVTRTQRLITVYATARPIIAALAAMPIIPAKWRSVLSLFVMTLDEVTATFKAGKDLAIAPVEGGGVSVEMEPKLPA